MGLPALHDKNCEGKGKHQETDGGLDCFNCWSARKKTGNSNPSRWTSKSYCELKKVED